MDTQVQGTAVVERKLGNLPEDVVTFYEAGKKPEAPKVDGFRFAFLGFKVSKDKTKKRENMMVRIPAIDSDAEIFGGVKGHAFVNALIAEYQDSVIGRSADGEVNFADATNSEFLIADYFDSSRDSSGRKVTKESILAWYMDKLGGIVATRALAKNAQMKDENLANVVKAYGEMFQKLTKYDLPNIYTAAQLTLVKQLVAEVKAVAEDDDMLEWVESRISKIDEACKGQDDLLNLI